MNIETCFECGSKHMKLVKKDVVLEKSNPGIIIPSISQFECESCGEKFLTEDQQAVLDKEMSEKLHK